MAPHVDFHRGGPAYAHAYKALAEHPGADRFIVFGTCHNTTRKRFALTEKGYDTPLGCAETDQEFVRRLAAKLPEDYFVDEFAHRGEHSVEFQVVCLKYLLGDRHPFKIVPILVGSFHDIYSGGKTPVQDLEIQAMVDAVLETMREMPASYCVIAGADLAQANVNDTGNVSAAINGTRPTSSSVFFNGIDATNFSGEGTLTENISPAPETIQELKLQSSLYDASIGRSGGGNIQIVTKSGTNDVHGSWFTLFRDDGLNAQTVTERINNIEKQAYARQQFGGSLGGPIVADKAHYFGAYERTQQDTKQVVSTLGLFPAEDGIYDVSFRETMFTGKLTVAPIPAHYLAVRYARDTNSQPTGAGLRAARSSWATSRNTYDSVNVNHNWVVGQSLNEFVFQYSSFINDIPATSTGPHLRFRPTP